jgi:ParB family transcriptional regulator, chromosome partitioning protein
MARRSGLGKGLNALLPDAVQEAPEGSELREIPIAQIRANPYQPRAVFDDEALASLASSIGELGVLQPILVRQVSDSAYELIAGERRWRASQIVGLDSIPAIVRTVEDDTSLRQALVENLLREDLNPLEEAAGYQQLIDEFDLTQDQVAVTVGRSRSAVANTLRLLALPPSIQARVVERSLSAGHARALLAVESLADQEALAQRIIDEGLNVRDTEDAVRRLVAAQYAGEAEPTSDDGPGSTRPAALLELERLLSDHLDTKVSVTVGGRRGRVVIDFANLEDLERIYRVMVSGREGESE